MKRALPLVLLLACSTPSGKRVQAPSDPGLGEDQGGHLAHLYSELQDDILTSYDRDEPPDLDTAMIDRKVGTARIGAGPNDVYIAEDLARAPSRWPLPLDRATRSEVRSKQLAIQIAADQQAAWMSDELSWRIELCGRTTVVPLRITGLYAHDGDRWVPVFEHLSFGTTGPLPSDAPPAKPIKAAVVSRDLSDELSGLVGRGLFPGQRARDASVMAQDGNAIVLGPGAIDEWRASHVLEAKLPAGRDEDHRIGAVGRDPATATVAYWIGTYLTDPGKLRLRVSYVFEKRCAAAGKRDCKWQVVQAHMSQPITDEELAHQVFGTALSAVKPLALDCEDGGARPAAATLRRAPAAAGPPSPPAARSR